MKRNKSITEIKPRIIFKGLVMDGKHQKEWFKIFDLLDEIFTDKEKEKMSMQYLNCTIKNFNFQTKELPKGTTKREFADFLAGVVNRNKFLEVNIRTGKLTFFEKKKQL